MVRLLRLAPLAAALCILPGCLQRTLRITSNPPGAVVWVNDVEVGTTPLDVDFTYYGGYDVRLRRAGYEPILALKKIEPPLYERPGLDLLSEALPMKIENTVVWHFDLEPTPESINPAAAEAGMIDRAKDMRARIEGPAASAPSSTPAESRPEPAVTSPDEPEIEPLPPPQDPDRN